jgi:hypothetical protein
MFRIALEIAAPSLINLVQFEQKRADYSELEMGQNTPFEFKPGATIRNGDSETSGFAAKALPPRWTDNAPWQMQEVV